MSKQRTLIALDWLMPVLQDIFDEQNHLLRQDDKPMDWDFFGQSLHQVSGALMLTNQVLLAKLANTLEKIGEMLHNGQLSEKQVLSNGQSLKKNLVQALHLLQYEIQQLQRKQKMHDSWVADRIIFLYELIGEQAPDLSSLVGLEELSSRNQDNSQPDDFLPLLSKLPIPQVTESWQDENVENLKKLWRYSTLQLLQKQTNDKETLENLVKIANYLARTPLNSAFRQVWHLVALWFGSLSLNKQPTPEQYVIFLTNLEALLNQEIDKAPDFDTGRLAVDVLLHLSELEHKTESAEALLVSLDLNDKSGNDTLFGQVLGKLEKVIYQIYNPQVILPILHEIKEVLTNRGWMYYAHHLEVIISDVQMMVDDEMMASSLAWQVERQLQDLYSQILSTVETLDSHIGIHHFAYASSPEQEAVRQTRINLENVKRAFNEYTKTHNLVHLDIQENLVSMIQVFGMLELTRPKELAEQLRILLNRIYTKKVAVLSWEATDAIAEMIARYELFLDYLSHQSVSEELLDETQKQLNRANLLVKNLIDKPISEKDLLSREKVFGSNTIIYDDEGEKIINANAQSNLSSTVEANNEVVLSEEFEKARDALKPDDFELADEDIREIFIEEAGEVLEEMDNNLPAWQAQPSDLGLLKEVRRGFHTLKGSGRMVGANQLGEMAWAVENMLNRVLDGTLPSTSEIADFIGETRKKIPTLVQDFANMQAPSIDPAITVLQANNLLSGKPINTGLTENQLRNPAPIQTAVPEAPVEQTDSTIPTDDTGTQVSTVAVDKFALDGLMIERLPDVVKAVYAELPVVEDGESDADIQEIYIEEANEVLEEITPLYAVWQTDTSDMATLKEFRRGWHTLKGSGRMVGANQLGELAWSIENMLNRVMDNTIVVSDGLVALVGDVLGAFGGLVDIFAKGETQYPQIIRVWSAIAHTYAKKQGEELDYDEMMKSLFGSEFVVTSNVSANMSEPETVADTDNENETADCGQLEEEKTSACIFKEEAQELINKVDTFINESVVQDKVPVTDELIRIFHTLRGGSAVAKLFKMHALSELLEQDLGEFLRKEIPLRAEQLALLRNVKDDLQDCLDNVESQVGVELTDDDHDDLLAFHEELLSNVSLTHVVSVTDLLALEIDNLIDAEDVLPSVFAGDEEQIVSYAEQLEAQANRLADALEGLSYVSICETLYLVYHKLTTYPSFAKDPLLLDYLLKLHDQLVAMLDTIAAGLNVVVDKELIAQTKQLLIDKQYQAQMDAIVYEKVDTDIELLQIFLAESQELKKIIQTNLNQWQNNLTHTEVWNELRRQYHTLKGGANMVGILSIAQLAKQAEQMYNVLMSGKVANDPDIALVMYKVYETTQVQLQYVQQQKISFFADDLIEQLEQLSAGTILAHDIIPAVPIIVDINQDDVAIHADDDEVDEATSSRADPMYVQEIINNFEQRRLDTWQGQEPDEDILGVYLEEAKELIDSSSQNLQEFRSNTNNISALQALQRELHTIKGGARMVGAEGIATLAHEMETIYEELGSRRKPATRMVGNLLASCHDWLASSMFVLENKYNPQTPTTLIRALQDFSVNPDSLKEIPTVSLASQIEQIEIYQSSLNQDESGTKRDLSIMPSMAGNFETEQEQTNLNAEMLRISAGLMERMINLSGESAINRARIEMGVSSLTNTIEEMGSTVQRLADQLRRMEIELEVQILAQIADEHSNDIGFDPLEMDQYSALNQLSKSLSESASDLVDIKATMLEKTRDTENLLLQLSRTQTELQEGLMNSRTVPFSRITARLQRIVRQTATELGKSVELRILNDEGEIDRNILERITSPLEHMIRNAVDHGVERPQERIENGKSRTGLITLELQREGGEIVIHLSDDGKGINVDAVRKKAIEQGLISATDTSLKPLDIMQYIFNAGLSTAQKVSQISGRGVGMDVVQSEVKQLGGVVLVDSELGKGSRFTMRLPLTVAVSDALVVRAGDKQYAIPLVQIERVLRINTETIYQFHSLEATTLNIDGEDYRLRYLNQIMYGSDPLETLSQHSASVPVIIIRTDTGQRMALQVDAIAGSRIEVVVKPLGPQLSHISGISAATIMGDGSVMLILDLIALMRNASNVKVEKQKAKQIDVNRKPVVLIIDDSVTVRKVTSRLLERHGYEAQIATDGVDAIEKLQDLTPDIMLLDIEMPRMDGFEVATQVRHNERLREVPIIMITSRTGEKHRERAMSIGVNEYKGKPFQEQDLLDTIARLIREKAVN